MGRIEWKPSLETGHAKIDEQHRGMVEALNHLHAEASGGKDKEDVGRALRELRQRTTEHFRMEEELMARFDYPAALEHNGVHGNLVSQFIELCTRYEEGRTALTMPVLDFLEGWLVEHIQGEDVRLTQFLKARGNMA